MRLSNDVSKRDIISNFLVRRFSVFVVSCVFGVLALHSQTMAKVADSTIFAITLDGGQTNSCAGNGSDRTGFAICVLNSDSTQLSIHVEHDINLANLIGGHIHFGAECTSGPIAFGFGALTSPIDINWAIDPTNLQRLLNGELYINFHTSANPAEEIRGQIVQAPRKFNFTLDESQTLTTLTPRSFSHNNGVALCELNATADSLRIRLCHDVKPPFFSGLHVHRGPVGIKGPVIFFILDPVSPVDTSWNITKEDLVDLFTSNLYLNQHSNLHFDGEIRGQIVQEELRFVFGLNGAQANGGSGSANKGFGILTLSGDGSEVSVYMEHDIPFDSASAGHIHLGLPGNNGAALHSFASAASPITDTWPITDVEFEQLVSGQIYVDIVTPNNPSGEIRGQAPGVTDTLLTSAYPSCDVTIDAEQAAACAGSGSSNTASGFVELKKGGRQLNVSINHDFPPDSAFAGHLHRGPECTVGPVVFQFTQFTSPIKEIWYLSHTDIIDLMRDELYINLHTPLFPAGAGELRGQILKNQGCCIIPGDADSSGSFNIGDVTFGIARIFSGGPAPACQDEADANGDNMYNIADVTYGIARIFSGGPAPICGSTGK